MIESAYWKTELSVAADEIERRCTVRRWSEKQAVLLERAIMLAIFCVRSLLERSKLSKRVVDARVRVVAHAKKVQKPVTILNRGAVEELYDIEKPLERDVALTFLCNQIIHSYIIFPARDVAGNFSHILVCSDYERNRHLYSIAIKAIVDLLRNVAADSPNRADLKWDVAIQDYRLVNNN